MLRNSAQADDAEPEIRVYFTAPMRPPDDRVGPV